jgi:TonB-dependent starch-binding outer membrane protein SusC
MLPKISAQPKRPTGIYQQLSGRRLPVVLLIACLMIAQVSALAQDGTVQGKVTTEGGTPVSGASISVKGTTTGTFTDNSGEYRIKAARGAILVISNVGYMSKEITVGDNAQVDIQLAMDAQNIGEVVVVGYGTQRKKDLTGAVASVNLETMRDAPNTNIGQYLQGTIPGLNVGLSTFAGGTPPITIRGQVTLSGNRSVLIILDGVQYTGSLSSINPDDIGSIDILKDASSTAVYGAQASNGVILITSRKGRYNQKPRISFSSSYTHQQPTIGEDLKPMDREGLLRVLTEAKWDTAYEGPDYTTPSTDFVLGNWVDPILRFPNSTELLPNNYSWLDGATQDAFIFENSLSISGGSDRFNYLLSGALVNQKGYIINDIFKRKSIRANLEIKALDWWKVGLISSAAFVNQDGAEPSFGSINRMPPLVVPYDDAGKLKAFPLNTLEPSPLATYLVDDYDRHDYYFANIYSDIDLPFLKGLNYRMNFGNNYRSDKHFFSSQYDGGGSGRAYKEQQHYYDYTFDNILTYNRTFGDHAVTATLLYGAVERRYNRTFAEGVGFTRITLGYNNLGQAQTQRTTSGGWQEALSYQMGRLNYKFKDRYLLTATLRRDGFSGFAKNNKYANFPVLAVGWVVSDESFMKNLTAVDFLKLRVGYGATGNQIGRYSSIARVTPQASYVFGDVTNTAYGQFVETLGNDNLRWERTEGINAGVDFSLLNNRLSGALEYYKTTTNDLLFRVQIPTLTGFGDIISNLGELSNTGFEAQITYRIIDNASFKWSTTVNFSTNKNKIVTLTGQDLNGDGKEDDLLATGLFIGKSRFTIYDYEADGSIYGLNDVVPTGFYRGTYKVVDQNKDGLWNTTDDRIFIGRREPAYRWSIFNNFQYKGFTLTIFVNSVQGGKNGYLGNNNLAFFREDNSIRINYLQGMDFWSPSNPDGKYAMNISGSRARVEPNIWKDRSFIRLQDISLSYNFANTLLKKVKAQSINLFVSGKNLYTWTDWDGWDPEWENQDDLNALGGMRHDGRPVLRAFTVGLNIVY